MFRLALLDTLPSVESAPEDNALSRLRARAAKVVARIEGEWKIVCKLFAHTGGEPPEGI